MIFHIPCLKLWLFLCVAAFPSAYIYFAKPFIRVRESKLLSENAATVLIYGILLLLAWIMGITGPADFSAESIMDAGWKNLLFAAAAVMGFIDLVLEYLESALPVWVRSRRLPKVRPAAVYSETFHISSVVSIILAAAAEELVFRQVIIGGVCEGLGWAPWAAGIVSALLYGMNHVYFGRFAVIQKCSSGLIYSMFFLTGEAGIWLCILCHVSQNIILYCWSVRITAQQKRVRVPSGSRKEPGND